MQCAVSFLNPGEHQSGMYQVEVTVWEWIVADVVPRQLDQWMHKNIQESSVDIGYEDGSVWFHLLCHPGWDGRAPCSDLEAVPSVCYADSLQMALRRVVVDG
jgi:hypothetical protein